MWYNSAMDSVIKNLPEDPILLKKLLAEKHSENENLKAEILLLQEKINILLAKRFGPSSEKQTIDLSGEFNEAEDDQESAEAEEPETIKVPAHTRKNQNANLFPKVCPVKMSFMICLLKSGFVTLMTLS